MKPIRATQAEAAFESGIKDMLSKLTGILDKLLENKSQNSGNPAPLSQRQNKGNGRVLGNQGTRSNLCFYCNSPNHFKRDCEKMKRDMERQKHSPFKNSENFRPSAQ